MCVMAAGDLEHVFDRRPSGDVDLLGALVHGLTCQRHPVFPADKPAYAPGACLHRTQSGGVSLPPDDALGVGRHELAMMVHDLATGVYRQDRIIQGSVARTGCDSLVDRHDPHDTKLLGSLPQVADFLTVNGRAVLV